MMSEVEQYEMKLPFGVNLSLSRVPGSNFEVVASKDSAGVQVIDHILWVACRIINGHDVPSSCRDLFGYLEDTASNWFITREAMLNYWHGEMQKLYSLPYSKADENRAQEFLDKEKAKRHAKVNRANENP